MDETTWINRKLVDDKRWEARQSASAALDQLADAGSTDDAAEAANALAAADAHFEQARSAIEEAFRGIDS